LHFNKGGEKGKIFFIGDSHLRNIFSVLKDDLIKLDYEVQVMLNADCWYIPDFNLTYSLTQKKLHYCTSEFQDNVRKILVKENKSIIVFGGRLPRYLSNKPFNNNEGGVESENWPLTFYSTKKTKKYLKK
jgi:hypothetical protein